MRAGRHLAVAALLGLTACGGSAGSPGASGAAAPASPSPAADATPTASSSSMEAPSLVAGAYTARQAETGATVFTETCAECHDRVEMHGSDFMFEWEGSSVGRLFRYIQRTMPDDAPGSLPEDAYVTVVAYILSLNDFPAGSVELTADTEKLNALTIAR